MKNVAYVMKNRRTKKIMFEIFYGETVKDAETSAKRFADRHDLKILSGTVIDEE